MQFYKKGETYEYLYDHQTIVSTFFTEEELFIIINNEDTKNVNLLTFNLKEIMISKEARNNIKVWPIFSSCNKEGYNKSYIISEYIDNNFNTILVTEWFIHHLKLDIL